jgi:hypothetical protein
VAVQLIPAWFFRIQPALGWEGQGGSGRASQLGGRILNPESHAVPRHAEAAGFAVQSFQLFPEGSASTSSVMVGSFCSVAARPRPEPDRRGNDSRRRPPPAPAAAAAARRTSSFPYARHTRNARHNADKSSSRPSATRAAARHRLLQPCFTPSHFPLPCRLETRTGRPILQEKPVRRRPR